MNDPHVVSLRYRVKTDGSVSYNQAPEVTLDKSAYEMTLLDDVLTVRMKEHCPTVESAMRRVEDELKAWEIQAALDSGRGCLNFELEDAEVIDRNPPPPGTPSAATAAINLASLGLAGGVTCHVVRGKYPDPPSNFAASPMVKHLWNRYQMYLDRRDLLTTMGYVCLSTIQEDAGDRRQASIKYSIDPAVLSMLGTLTSDVGDLETARKFDNRSTKRAHTPGERAWVEAVVKRIIRRVGERDHNPTASLPQITMADFPSP
jgi:hypothetical protein